MNTETKLMGSTAMLAAVAAAGAPGSALAADFMLKAPPAAPPSWQGLYVGGSLGVSWLSSTQDDTAYNFTGYGYGTTTGLSSNQAQGVGVLGGLQVGYDWQSRNFVYGLVGDISFLGAKASSHGLASWAYSADGYNYGYSSRSTRSSKVDALATIRARFGIDIDGTMPYLTAGLALGHIKDTYTTNYGGPYIQTTSSSSWTPGLVVGGGIEHNFGNHWSMAGEILWVGFKDRDLSVNDVFGYGYPEGTVKFSNSLVLGKIGLNYRF